jgi:hypothetical protein
MQTMVETAIRRETTETVFTVGSREHRHRMPLGLILLAQGWITNEQLQHALDLQRRAGQGRIGEWLIAKCGVDQDRVLRGLGLQWQSPVLSVAGFDPAAMTWTVPKALIERTGVVPLRIASGRILYLGWEDRPDAAVAFAIARMSGLRVESGLVDTAELGRARQQLCGCPFVKATVEQVGNTELLAQRMASVLARMRPRASHLVRVHHLYWLRMWLEMGSMSPREGDVPATGDDVVDCVYLVGSEQ